MKMVRKCIFVSTLGTVMLLPACDKGGKPPTPEQGVDPAIATAKIKENGDSLKNGESKEVPTAMGVVIVSRDENGKVTYKKK